MFNFIAALIMQYVVFICIMVHASEIPYALRLRSVLNGCRVGGLHRAGDNPFMHWKRRVIMQVMVQFIVQFCQG